MDDRKLLREYVRAVLREDFGGGDYAGLGLSGGMVGPYGVAYTDPGGLFHIFVEPFTDALKVAAGKTKELTRKGATLLRVAFESIATTLIPILKDNYKEIFEEEKAAIDKIRSEYADVYQGTWDALSDNDVLAIAFMYNPVFFITTQLAKKAPAATASLLSVLTGGALDDVLSRITAAAGKPLKPYKHPRTDYGVSRKGVSGTGGMGGGYGGYDYSDGGYASESIIYEKEKPKRDASGDESPLEKLVAHKKVKQLLNSSQRVQQMQQVGQEVVHNTLQKVYDQAAGVLKATSLADLQKKVGKPLPGQEELDKAPPQEKQKAEQLLLKSVREGMREFYLKQLEGQVKRAMESGVPKDHPFVKAYEKTISSIRSL